MSNRGTSWGIYASEAQSGVVVEAIVFFILLYAFISVAAMHRMWLRQRDRRRERWIAKTLDDLGGKSVSEALDRFGSPFEVIEGTERSFYVWKSPPSEKFPVGAFSNPEVSLKVRNNSNAE